MFLIKNLVLLVVLCQQRNICSKFFEVSACFLFKFYLFPPFLQTIRGGGRKVGRSQFKIHGSVNSELGVDKREGGGAICMLVRNRSRGLLEGVGGILRAPTGKPSAIQRGKKPAAVSGEAGKKKAGNGEEAFGDTRGSALDKGNADPKAVETAGDDQERNLALGRR